jgi:hypothetical protein
LLKSIQLIRNCYLLTRICRHLAAIVNQRTTFEFFRNRQDFSLKIRFISFRISQSAFSAFGGYLLFDFWFTLTSISVRNKVCNARSMIATNPAMNASLWLVRSNIHGRRERRREGRSGELRECRTYGNSSTILFCTSSSIYPLKRKLSFYDC